MSICFAFLSLRAIWTVEAAQPQSEAVSPVGASIAHVILGGKSFCSSLASRLRCSEPCPHAPLQTIWRVGARRTKTRAENIFGKSVERLFGVAWRFRGRRRNGLDRACSELERTEEFSPTSADASVGGRRTKYNIRRPGYYQGRVGQRLSNPSLNQVQNTSSILE